MSNIQLSYIEMRAVARDIQSQAEQARSVITSLQKSVSRLLPTWAGASKAAFETAYVPAKQNLDEAPVLLDQVSLALFKTADIIEQAEHEAQANIEATITADDALGG